MSNAPVVSIVDGSAELGRQVILSDLSLEVGQGEIVAVVGANGSGKSTLLRLIVGLIRPRSGSVRLFEKPPNDLAALRRVGATIDTPALYPWMSGRAVLRTLLSLSGEADRGRSAIALKQFGLHTAGRKPVVRYSQGMRKRLALAAASLRAPDLLILDEPTNALDADGRAIVADWIATHRAAGGSAVIATHRASDAELCDRVVRLADGQLTETNLGDWSRDPGAQT
ncbi:MAG: ATP-binding cassette domain-containing protein [Jatrophihabitantaceae bacterium]